MFNYENYLKMVETVCKKEGTSGGKDIEQNINTCINYCTATANANVITRCVANDPSSENDKESVIDFAKKTKQQNFKSAQSAIENLQMMCLLYDLDSIYDGDFPPSKAEVNAFCRELVIELFKHRRGAPNNK